MKRWIPGCGVAFAGLLLLTASASGEVVEHPPPVPPGTLLERLQCLFGFAVFLLMAYGIGRWRGQRITVSKKPIAWGIVLQFAFGAFVVWNPALLYGVNATVNALLQFTADGARIVFGALSSPQGAPVEAPDGTTIGFARNVGYFAFFVLPTIIFFSCLTAVLYHIGIMQYVVQGLAWIMAKTMRTSGAETLAAVGNIFVGQTEAPLMVRPFLAIATRSELMAIMVGGFANIASGVLGLYTIWLRPFIPDAAGHLAAACFISAPASLLVAKLIVPETEQPQTAGGVEFKVERVDANMLDAATRGTTDGLTLALNVGAMLITFTALIALVNYLLGWGTASVGLGAITLQDLFGWIFRPIMWLAGVSWAEAQQAGSLLGIKTVLNELVAYSEMKDALAADPAFLSPRARLLTLYALCGFANFASVGIQIGGISVLAPTRRHDLSRLGMLAMVGGTIASLMTACVVGVLV